MANQLHSETSDNLQASLARINDAVKAMKKDPDISNADKIQEEYSNSTLAQDSDGGIEVTEKEITQNGDLYGAAFKLKSELLKGTNLTDEEKLLALHGIQNQPFLELLNKSKGDKLPDPEDIFKQLLEKQELELQKTSPNIQPEKSQKPDVLAVLYNLIECINRMQNNPKILDEAIAQARPDSDIELKLPETAFGTNVRSQENLAQEAALQI